MKKTEIYLYLKTLLFNFVFTLIFTIPSFLVMGVMLGIFYGIDITTLDDYPTNFTVFIAELILTIIVCLPLNILTGNYFYKKAKNLDLKKVLNTYIKIGVGLNIIFLISDLLFSGFNIYNIILTFVTLVFFLIIFRNVVSNHANLILKNFSNFLFSHLIYTSISLIVGVIGS